MATHKVTTPAPGFRGEVAGVYFRDGVAEVDFNKPVERSALAYFRRRGYGVEEIAQRAPVASVRPKDYAPKPDWVTYAISLGADADQAEALTKAELVDQYGNTSNEEEIS